jgi:TM2 domain-containing membrane protein YozV
VTPPAVGFVPYPAEPDDAAVLARPLRDPTPGYFVPDPAQAVVPANPVTATANVTRREVRRARRQIQRGQVSDEALRRAAASLQVTPDAPYGRDPLTGEPRSDKFKLVAAFLQFPFGPVGLGRFYLGYQLIGFISVAVFLVSLAITIAFGWWFLWVVLGLWSLIDCVQIIGGHVPDAEGRKLK